MTKTLNDEEPQYLNDVHKKNSEASARAISEISKRSFTLEQFKKQTEALNKSEKKRS